LLYGYPGTYSQGGQGRLGTGANNHGAAWLWDPSLGTGTNAFAAVPPPTIAIDGTDRVAPIYCSGETLLANDDLLVTGGTPDLTARRGLSAVFTFDPFTETRRRQRDLPHGRWFPGQVLAPDGRVLILGGSTENGSSETNLQMEQWPAAGTAVPGTDARGA